MERVLSVSETRGRLTGLVQQIAEGGGERSSSPPAMSRWPS
jgi:hypothetical protein